MKIDNPINENYAATIVRVYGTNKLEGLDNLRALNTLGMQALIPKDYELGMLGVLIPTEAQVSHEFAAANNLYRDSTANADKTAKGYLEASRRVKAIKLRGHHSNALFLPLTSLDYLGIDTGLLTEGMTFDHINGHEVVRKYTIRVPESRADKIAKKHEKAWRRVDAKMLPEHVDTDNWFRNEHAVPKDARLIVSQKVHGTSVRVGRTIVKRQLTWIERLLDRFGLAVIAKTEYAVIGGSRKVIKDPENERQNHYYQTDIWSAWAERIGHLIPENYILYGELVGWVEGGKPIQQGYTYEVPVGESELYVYRVAVINGQGRLIDLAWEQVKGFCREVGLKWVPEFQVTTPGEFSVEPYMDANYTHDTWRTPAGHAPMWAGGERPVPLPKGTVDEGVVIRVEPREGGQPWMLKAKSPAFFEHETKLLDKGIVDVESAEAVAA